MGNKCGSVFNALNDIHNYGVIWPVFVNLQLVMLIITF